MAINDPTAIVNETSPIVLVVDDSPDSLGMINQALNQAGYTALVALNGQQALDIVQQIKPNVVLMDAVMPVMDGFECCREVRKILPLTPIIFMTGLTDVEHIVKAFEHGGNDYIKKPINPDELLARITAHVKNANMTNDARMALDIARQHVLAVNNEGDVLWTTPETRELLYFHGINPEQHHNNPEQHASAFTAKIKHWLDDSDKRADLVISTVKKPLVFRYFKSVHNNEHLLRLSDQNILRDPTVLESALQLTKREAEVLLWVAQGKTNKEIGEILDMSPRTVNKHLEQIYTKLYVDNRAAATSLAIQALLGMPV